MESRGVRYEVEGRALPCLYAFTTWSVWIIYHQVFQRIIADFGSPIAQLITVGKRAAQWAHDLMFDLECIEQVRNGLKFRGTIFNCSLSLACFCQYLSVD